MCLKMEIEKFLTVFEKVSFIILMTVFVNNDLMLHAETCVRVQGRVRYQESSIECRGNKFLEMGKT